MEPTGERPRILNSYRKEFPLTRDLIYMNHASQGPLPQTAVEELESLIRAGQHPQQEQIEYAFRAIEEARKGAAQLIGADPREIGIGFNTSFGLNIAIQGLDLSRGENVILSDVEFPANVYPWLSLRQEGVEVRFARSRDRFTSLEEIFRLTDNRTRAIGLSWVQFFNGFRNDLRALGDFCRSKEIFSVIDGIQGVGVLRLDVKEANIDFLSCGGQKWLLSPCGTGFFYCSKEGQAQLRNRFAGWLAVDWGMNFTNLLKYDLKPFPDMRRFEVGSYPYHDICGFRVALNLLLEVGTDSIEKHTLHLTDMLLEYLKESPYKVRSSLEPNHRSSIVSFSGDQNQELLQRLEECKISVSLREGGIRVSPHFYNTEEEMGCLIQVLKQEA